jgi:chemotaxis protein CheD
MTIGIPNSSHRRAKHCGIGFNLRVKSNPANEEPDAGRPSQPRRNRIKLFIGDVAASQSPVVLDTLLGSCVAVCLFDPVLRAGGMNHILLPNCGAGEKSPRCGIHAMELLINELMKIGADRRRFLAKAFGGASVLSGISILPVGEGNARFVREFLATEKIPLVAERLGGEHAVHLNFHTDTGKATVHTVDGSALPSIIRAEGSYCRHPPTQQAIFGEVTLF